MGPLETSFSKLLANSPSIWEAIMQKNPVIRFGFTADIDISESQANKILESLIDSLEKIYQGNSSSLRFEELYRIAYVLVINEYGGKLYEAVKVLIKEKLSRVHTVLSLANDENILLVFIQVRYCCFSS
jgi:hypothetical protein